MRINTVLRMTRASVLMGLVAAALMGPALVAAAAAAAAEGMAGEQGR